MKVNAADGAIRLARQCLGEVLLQRRQWGGTCIETQSTPDGLVAVGDSKDRTLGAHTFAPAEWQTFVTAVRDGSL
ncbi:DUF397 domain-containing protein [Streptomyces microflavus]